MDIFSAICQALGFGLAVGILCGVVLPVRLRLSFAASIGTALAGLWLRAEEVTFWPMLPIGLFGMFTAGVTGDVFAGASRRESMQSGERQGGASSGFLIATGVIVAIVVAAVAWLVPPSAIVVAFAVLFLHFRRRRARPEKHEGLRILR